MFEFNFHKVSRQDEGPNSTFTKFPAKTRVRIHKVSRHADHQTPNTKHQSKNQEVDHGDGGGGHLRPSHPSAIAIGACFLSLEISTPILRCDYENDDDGDGSAVGRNNLQ